MTASAVYSLEERVRQLEGTVAGQDMEGAEDGAAEDSLARLEEEVARAAAKVTQSEKQVGSIFLVFQPRLGSGSASLKL